MDPGFRRDDGQNNCARNHTTTSASSSRRTPGSSLAASNLSSHPKKQLFGVFKNVPLRITVAEDQIVAETISL